MLTHFPFPLHYTNGDLGVRLTIFSFSYTVYQTVIEIVSFFNLIELNDVLFSSSVPITN